MATTTNIVLVILIVSYTTLISHGTSTLRLLLCHYYTGDVVEVRC